VELYLLDAEGRRIANIAEYSSLTWRTNLTGARVDAELPLSLEESVREAVYLERDDSDVLALITSRVADHESRSLKVEARDPIELLSRRVNFWTRNYSGQRLEAIVVDLVNAALSNRVELPGVNRMIPLWQRMVDTGATSRHLARQLTTQVSWQDCYSKVCELLEDSPLRFYTRFADGLIVPVLYEGIDRSHVVVVSVADGDLSKVVHSQVDEGICDVAVIGGQGEGAGRVVTTVGVSDLDVTHGELWVDASSIGDDNGALTPPQVLAALREHGREKLFEQPREDSVAGAAAQTRFEFGKDYFVGDRIGFRTDCVRGSDVITEVEEVFEGGSKVVNIVVGKSYPTIREIVEKRTL